MRRPILSRPKPSPLEPEAQETAGWVDEPVPDNVEAEMPVDPEPETGTTDEEVDS